MYVQSWSRFSIALAVFSFLFFLINILMIETFPMWFWDWIKGGKKACMHIWMMIYIGIFMFKCNSCCGILKLIGIQFFFPYVKSMHVIITLTSQLIKKSTSEKKEKVNIIFFFKKKKVMKGRTQEVNWMMRLCFYYIIMSMKWRIYIL